MMTACAYCHGLGGVTTATAFRYQPGGTLYRETVVSLCPKCFPVLKQGRQETLSTHLSKVS